MILAGNQPCYLPYMALFNRIARADIYMHSGHLQFSNKSFHNRTYIKGVRLTVPVSRTFGDQINQVVIKNNEWIPAHFAMIEAAYKDEPYFNSFFPRLADLLMAECSFLDIFNRRLIDFFCHVLSIETKIVDSAQWHFEGTATEKNIQMCRAVGADWYLQSINGRDFTDEQEMNEAGIGIVWQHFKQPDYGQDMNYNEGKLSIIDPLARLGPKRTRELVFESWVP